MSPRERTLGVNQHYWIKAPLRGEREALISGLDLPPVLAEIDAHRRLRGPFTAAGTLIRAIVHDAFARCPELAARFNIEITTVAPELADAVPQVWDTLEWTVSDEERTRFYSRLHTLYIANGLADLLSSYLRALGGGPRTLLVENAHHADPTDQEFLAILLRRNDLPELTLVVGTGVEPIPAPGGEPPVLLADNLVRYARLVEGPVTPIVADLEGDLARLYVDTDCTSDDPRLLAAYDELSPSARAALHDDRLAALRDIGELSLTLGAIPYHAEHGGNPHTVGVNALEHAMNHCRKVGLYHASADLGSRGRKLLDLAGESKLWWHFTEGASISLATMGRADESLAIYDDARASSIDPIVHMQLAYGTAMLYARHFTEARRDFQQARAWMNLSIALAAGLDVPTHRSFYSVFNRNGLALIEVRQGKPDEALRLLEDGMAKLDSELKPDEHLLHRSVLRYNRAQVFDMTGRPEDALADFTAVMELDPHFPEHHFNIGNVLRKLGRHEEALASYLRVLPLSPPMPEVYYNIADTRVELGDVEGALAAYERVLQLDPGHVESYLNRAGVRCDLDDQDGAWADVTTGLELAPANAHLLSLKGRLLAEQGELVAAEEALTLAVEHNAKLAEAWAVRGQLRYEAGNIVGAIEDFDRAVELADGPAIRFNRAIVFEEAGRYADAATDYRTVLAAEDDMDARDRLDFCLRTAANA
jgi:tetratricopeptide (TPR) repeat protein